MKLSITEKIKKERLYFDGGTGTVLQSIGLPFGKAPEAWNLECPEKIESLHRAYIDAGANIIKTNSFGVSSKKYGNYKELIRAAIAIAKRAAEGREDVYIAFDMGPLGSLLAPFGDMAFEDAVAIFKNSATVAAEEGVDLILIETMNDAYETKAAVIGAKEGAPALPIFVTNVYDERAKLMTGADPEAMICMLEGLGVSAIGMNCSLGPDKMAEILPRFIRSASVPIIVNPNAGLPSVLDGEAVFDCSADKFSEIMVGMAECGAHILGGCCGTTPEYIRLTVQATGNITYPEISEKEFTRVSSYTHAVDFSGAPVLIGERINPTGKPKLKEALRSSDIDYIVAEAVGEEEAGAVILDVNVGLPEICECEMMQKALGAIMAVSDLPLQIDSSDPKTLSAAMRMYNGKPLVNSVNGKREIMDAVLPEVKKYGAAVIALTLDENGIPDTALGRVEIAERIIAVAAEYGIAKKDIIVDPLALSVSSDPASARVTLDAIRELTKRGIKTSLGVSNISFGLPMRDKINSTFFTLAMQAGLSAAIMNPYSSAMMDSYRAYKVLCGLDEGCAEYIGANAADSKVSAPAPERAKIDLFYAVKRGLKDRAAALAEQALATREPLAVINELLIPALNEIGREFELGRAYLPELLMSAEAASVAFSEIKKRIPESRSSGRSVILATVKGDIHDIGKNIVKVLLESYGFSVIDLGRDVAPERIVDTAIEKNIRLVGLSALMTTTVESMRETIALMRERAPEVKVIVGGAVLTPEYAEMIGADFYGADAMETVRIAEKFYG
ncbi:MAG: homocysteine S-methyltransferase family protein [Clostridia bacterium]|nr:homocysteine S-methyltransferase family protein [Clostridia bacterium]